MSFETSIHALLVSLDLDIRYSPYLLDIDSDFPFKVPCSFIKKIKKGDWYDPLLLQILPLRKEREETPGYSVDPVGDKQAEVQMRLFHKYKGRVLFACSHACAIHCRYCFRKKSTVQKQNTSFSDMCASVFSYIKQYKTLSEIIVSGGDPLMLSNDDIGIIFEHCMDIDHCKTIRIHSRIPVIYASRINRDLLKCIANLQRKKTVIFVLHINHIHEVGADFYSTIQDLKNAGVSFVLSQTVLLKHINDSFSALHDLFHFLCIHGVVPYYVHQLDQVCGTAHFKVDIEHGRNLFTELRKALPGYCVPRYVQEIPHALYKIPL